jgi:hypothetical protein
MGKAKARKQFQQAAKFEIAQWKQNNSLSAGMRIMYGIPLRYGAASKLARKGF